MSGMRSLLTGKVSIITGASSGLGRAIALAFNQHGATVICADRDMGQSPSTNELIRDAGGGENLFVPTDVSSARSVRELVKTVAQKFGRVDVMVNNAGIAPEASNPRPVNETTEEVFDSTWQVNVRGESSDFQEPPRMQLQKERWLL
ncbi:hypothetical protein AbraIFM66950_008889 [Aspergillus brasiliensis]|nr:hypothetical protein AbraIFM66950_008889 [Aspergillus brasiliensis]